MSEPKTFILAASGEADSYRRDLFEARIRATVRYADPAAWMTATAVAFALAEFGDLLAQWRHEIGIIAISDLGPAESMTRMQTDATTGFSSPLHYAASSPGTLAGVSCIAFGLRGPTMNLTMAAREGVPVALTLCAGWLGRKTARLMLVATCRGNGSIPGLSRAVLLAPPGLLQSGKPLTESAISWLAFSGREEGVQG
ncbi:MAG: hypothetical protein ABSD44_09360 [Terracidiphilus sp.]